MNQSNIDANFFPPLKVKVKGKR